MALAPGVPSPLGQQCTHLAFGQQRGVLEHVHDDDKELIHPLSHLQAANLPKTRPWQGVRLGDKDTALGGVWWLTPRKSKARDGEAGGAL